MSGATFTRYLVVLAFVLLVWVVNHANLIKKGKLELRLPQKYTFDDRVVVASYFMGVPMTLALIIVMAITANRLAAMIASSIVVNGIEPALKRLKHVPF